MKKTVSESTGAYYQHYPRVAVIVTASADGKENGASIAWHTSISKTPPLFGVSIAQGHYTYELAAKSKEFAVNFLPDSKAGIVAAFGGSKGRQIDKFKAFRVEKEAGCKTSAPVMKDAYAVFECKLIDDRHYGDHQLLVGEVVAVHYSEEMLNENGTLDLEKMSPTMYLGAELYLNTDGCCIRTLNRADCVDKLKK